MRTSEGNQAWRDTAWRDLGSIAAAQSVMLRDVGLFDDSVLAALLTALDGINRATPPSVQHLSELIATHEERLDALTPAGVVGAASIGRARNDTSAALARLADRTHLLTSLEAMSQLRRALLDLAVEHITTLLPAYSGSQAMQPTTFAHTLGGLLGPLGRISIRLQSAFADLNQSPLGALSLTSSGLSIDREGVAALLGFVEPIAHTFDAVAAIDPYVTTFDALAALAAAIRRWLEELLSWIRTDPHSFRFTAAWRVPGAEPQSPQFNPPSGVQRLIISCRQTESAAGGLTALLHAAPYGPIESTIDAIYNMTAALFGDINTILESMRDLVSGGLTPNRAALANRAGKEFTTVGDLADLLMLEETLDPAAARAIAALAVTNAQSQGLEVTGITPEIVDASALLVIGRELGLEAERLGRHLAPRRFVERRTAPGAPSPVAMRRYLSEERERVKLAHSWLTSTKEDLAAAAATLAASTQIEAT
ncbi:MAG: lyase family protein [Chloroflexota bacterium]|nr:lyase family protein [Chloroflexota bacterium]